MSHITKCLLNSFNRSFTLPMQCNEYPKTRWSCLREVAATLSSRVGQAFCSCFKKAASGTTMCRRRADFCLRRPLRAELLQTPRTLFQNMVMEITHCPKGVAQVIAEYHFDESPEVDRAQIVNLGREMPGTEPFQAMVVAAGVAGTGATAVVVGAAALTALTGGYDLSVPVILLGHTGFIRIVESESSKHEKHWKDTRTYRNCLAGKVVIYTIVSAGIIACAGATGAGEWKTAAVATVGTAITGVVIRTLQTKVYLIKKGLTGDNTSYFTRAVHAGSLGSLTAAWISALMKVAPLRRLLIEYPVIWVTGVTASLVAPTIFERITGKRVIKTVRNLARSDAIKVALLGSAANIAKELITGRPFHPAGFIVANAGIAAICVGARYLE